MKATEKRSVKIPIEIFLDVCRMISSGELINKVSGANEMSGEVFMELKIQKGNKIQEAALDNIYEVVNEWNQYRYGDENPDDINLI